MDISEVLTIKDYGVFNLNCMHDDSVILKRDSEADLRQDLMEERETKGTIHEGRYRKAETDPEFNDILWLVSCFSSTLFRKKRLASLFLYSGLGLCSSVGGILYYDRYLGI